MQKKKKSTHLDTHVIPFTKVNSKRILNVKCKTLKVLEDNIGENYMTLVILMFFRYNIKYMIHERNN